MSALTEVPSFYIENHHTAIISREQFQRCRQISEMRRTPHPDMPGKYNNQYPLGDKLVCPICGSRLFQRSMKIQRTGSGWSCEIGEPMTRRTLNGPKGIKHKVWTCRGRHEGRKGNGCKLRTIKEDLLLQTIEESIGCEVIAENAEKIKRVVITEEDIAVETS